MSAIQSKLTLARKAAFLKELDLHGIVARAARAASPHSKNGCIQSFYDERVRDEGFGVAWDEALAQAMGAIEHEVHRRGVEGYEEPVFGGRYKEVVVGTVRRYSDRLLELRIRAMNPAYQDRKHFEIDASVAELRRKAAEEEKALDEAMRRLTKEECQQLNELLTKSDPDE